MNEEECSLLRADSPEAVQQRVLTIMEKMAAGKPMVALTETDLKNVEEALKKIQAGVREAKRTMLTEEDILNVANLNFFSPVAKNSDSLSSGNFDFSSPLRDPSPLQTVNSDGGELLDYEESIGGDSECSFGPGTLRIVTESDDEMDLLVEQRTKKPAEFTPKPATIKEELPTKKSPPSGRKSSSPEIKIEASTENHTKKRKSPEIFVLSDSDFDTEVAPKKRARIVYDRRIKGEEDVETDRNDEQNVSLTNFSRKLTEEDTYVKLRKSGMHLDSDKLGLTYPLGVTFDNPTDTWFITNIPYQFDGNGNNWGRKKYTDIEGPLIDQPSAITVYKEGSEIAVLCSNHQKKPSICIINHQRNDKVTTFCTWKYNELDFTYPSRGLARTKGGNLITTDRPSHGPPRIRIFSKGSSKTKEITYLLKDAKMPSFIASSDDTVVVTDLGSPQTVIHLKIDDSDWKHVKFETLRVITTTGVNFRAEEMLNNQYFIYVSGVQIDKNGQIMVADAKNHHFKLFNSSMNFKYRIATDFPVPYVSSFHVNRHGECLILSTRETNKIHFAKLTSSNRLERHIKSAAGKRIGVKNPLCSKRRIFADDSD
uniref:FAM194 domain-containing protein n=1 Tax=Caenorhabditis tropicalis TaxID=1561998 RepID=A0A1I7TQG7_9PELO